MTRPAETPTDWPDYLTPPPTLEELMRHAAETDEGMESDAHMSQVTLLRDVLRYRYRERDDVFVGANVPLYFSALQVRNRDFKVPDLMVVLEAEPKDERPFWILWEENGRRPNLIVEILSPSTEAQDRGPKKRIYSRLLGVPEYFIHDLHTGELLGFRLTPNQEYAPITPDEHGRLPSEQLAGAMGVVAERYDQHDVHWLRLFEQDGTRSPTAAEAESQRAEAESQRAEAESQRADELAARIAEYERRFGKLPE